MNKIRNIMYIYIYNLQIKGLKLFIFIYKLFLYFIYKLSKLFLSIKIILFYVYSSLRRCFPMISYMLNIHIADRFYLISIRGYFSAARPDLTDYYQ